MDAVVTQRLIDDFNSMMVDESLDFNQLTGLKNQESQVCYPFYTDYILTINYPALFNIIVLRECKAWEYCPALISKCPNKFSRLI